MNTLKTTIILLILLLAACKKDFTFKKTTDFANVLKLNGYCYTKLSRANLDSLVEIIFLYNNGTCLLATSSENNLKNTEDSFINGSYHKNAQSYGESWGPYKIDNTTLYYERWFSQDSQPIHGYNCKILNDTTSELYETFNMVRGKQKNIRSMNEIYRFKKFTPKPDSTNKYVN